jgi:hypothetical protein
LSTGPNLLVTGENDTPDLVIKALASIVNGFTFGTALLAASGTLPGRSHRHPLG